MLHSRITFDSHALSPQMNHDAASATSAAFIANSLGQSEYQTWRDSYFTMLDFSTLEGKRDLAERTLLSATLMMGSRFLVLPVLSRLTGGTSPFWLAVTGLSLATSGGLLIYNYLKTPEVMKDEFNFLTEFVKTFSYTVVGTAAGMGLSRLFLPFLTPIVSQVRKNVFDLVIDFTSEPVQALLAAGVVHPFLAWRGLEGRTMTFGERWMMEIGEGMLGLGTGRLAQGGVQHMMSVVVQREKTRLTIDDVVYRLRHKQEITPVEVKGMLMTSQEREKTTAAIQQAMMEGRTVDALDLLEADEAIVAKLKMENNGVTLPPLFDQPPLAGKKREEVEETRAYFRRYVSTLGDLDAEIKTLYTDYPHVATKYDNDINKFPLSDVFNNFVCYYMIDNLNLNSWVPKTVWGPSYKLEMSNVFTYLAQYLHRRMSMSPMMFEIVVETFAGSVKEAFDLPQPTYRDEDFQYSRDKANKMETTIAAEQDAYQRIKLLWEQAHCWIAAEEYKKAAETANISMQQAFDAEQRYLDKLKIDEKKTLEGDYYWTYTLLDRGQTSSFREYYSFLETLTPHQREGIKVLQFFSLELIYGDERRYINVREDIGGQKRKRQLWYYQLLALQEAFKQTGIKPVYDLTRWTGGLVAGQ